MRRILPLLFLLTATAPPDEPIPPRYVDPRIRTVTYSEDEVVPISVSPGYQLTVELGRGEHIENIAIGDNGGWTVTPNKRGDFLFIKPLEGAQTTNLTVITEARTYLFELGASGMGSPYTLRFRYNEAGEDVVRKPYQMPGKFRLTGSRAIKPLEMVDDGTETSITLRPDHDLPAIFAIGADGTEKLVNGAMRDGRYVVYGLANRFILRLDKQMVRATRKPRLKD